MTNLVAMATRRITGLILLFGAIGYVGATFLEYDLPNVDLPQFVHTPAFYAGYLTVLVWCWLPVLVAIPSRRQVNLTPVASQFEVPMEQGATGWGEPFEMPPGSGQWYIQGYGQYFQWNSTTNEYEPYQG